MTAWIRQAIDLFLHLDKYLAAVTRTCGDWTCVLLFVIVFCETGLVVTPFLPGDSLLFAAGALCARNCPYQDRRVVCIAVRGGNSGGHGQLLDRPPRRPAGLSRQYPLPEKGTPQRTRQFYERHGGKTIILARFIPIIRTFAPFVAGIGAMNYSRFIVYNIIGGIAWVALCLFLGYYFGNLAFVKERFHLVILAIILISVLPIVVEYLRARLRRPRDGGSPASGALPMPPEEHC